MLTDKEMATEILTIEKNLSELYFSATEETRTNPLHCNLKSMLNDALINQFDTSDLLIKNGYYQVENVKADEIAKVKNKYNSAAQ